MRVQRPAFMIKPAAAHISGRLYQRAHESFAAERAAGKFSWTLSRGRDAQQGPEHPAVWRRVRGCGWRGMFALKIAFPLLIILMVSAFIVEAKRHASALERQERMQEHQSALLARLSEVAAEAVVGIYRAGGADAAKAWAKDASDPPRFKMTFHAQAEGQLPANATAKGRARTVNVDGRKAGTLLVTWKAVEPSPPSFMWSLAAQLALLSFTAAFCLLCGFLFIDRPLQRLTGIVQRLTRGEDIPPGPPGGGGALGRHEMALRDLARTLSSAAPGGGGDASERVELLERLRQEDRISVVGRTVSTIAHELGTPLNVVSGRAMMISMDNDSTVDAKDNAQIIAEQAHRMTSIIRKVVEFSRAPEADSQKVEVRRAVDKACALLAPLAARKNVQFRCEVTSRVAALTSEVKLLQILTNLLTNAMASMPAGGTIDIAAGPNHVRDPQDRHVEQGLFVEITVRYEGENLSPETRDNLFKPFYSMKRIPHAGNLSLSICHAAVRNHGGWIDVTSESAGVTRFSVHLPGEELL